MGRKDSEVRGHERDGLALAVLQIEFLRKRGISKEHMGKMVLRSPQILTYSLEGKLLAIEKKLLEIGLKVCIFQTVLTG